MKLQYNHILISAQIIISHLIVWDDQEIFRVKSYNCQTLSNYAHFICGHILITVWASKTRPLVATNKNCHDTYYSCLTFKR